MRIYIPTRGRVEKQITLRSLTDELREITWLVCPKSEVKELKKIHPNVVAQPDSVQGIAAKRAWIFKNAKDEKIVMLDDDMGFYARGEKGLLKEYATDKVLNELFAWIELKLEDYAHVGISSRMGNNHVEETVAHTTRMMHALCYHVPTVIKNVKFKSRVLLREDFDITLQLLRLGYDNIVRYDVCVAPGSYGAKGGCADERSILLSDSEAENLSKLHPGFVKVVQKDYKGVPRKEVVVQWKRAYRADL